MDWAQKGHGSEGHPRPQGSFRHPRRRESGAVGRQGSSEPEDQGAGWTCCEKQPPLPGQPAPQASDSCSLLQRGAWRSLGGSFGLGAGGPGRRSASVNASTGCVLDLVHLQRKNSAVQLSCLFFFKHCKVLCNDKEKKAHDKRLSFPFCLSKTKALSVMRAIR